MEPRRFHVNVPFRMLFEKYLPRFIESRLNPEIGFDAEGLERHSLEHYQYVAGELLKHDLAVTFHFPFMDLSPGSPDPGVRDLTVRRFERVTALIPLFRPRAAVCHTGYDWRRYGFIKEEWLRNSLSIWPQFARRAKEEGCPLMLENTYEDGPGDILPLIEALKPWGVGFCLDTGHQAVFGKASVVEWIGSFAGCLRHVHLHDNHGVRDDHLAPGEGNIDFGLVFREMKRVLPAPPLVTLEAHREEDVLPGLRFLDERWPWA